jgi:hypothetical protein
VHSLNSRSEVRRGKGLNKKVLCFVDECGTAGKDDFFLGAVFLFAKDAGRIDKIFTTLLEANVNELHAIKITDEYGLSLLGRFNAAVPEHCVMLFTRRATTGPGDAPTQYARAVVETVKMGIKRFRREMLRTDSIGNIDLIIDVNHQNGHQSFDDEIQRARHDGGAFKAVKNVAKIDSAAARLVQLADLTAYSRRWLARNAVSIETLRDDYNLIVL